MLVNEIYNGQGLGNQLWCYVFTRVLALDKGYDFGIMGPEKFKCLNFMNLDFGKSVIGGSGPEGGPPATLPNGITTYYREKAQFHPSTGFGDWDIRIADKNLFSLPDNIKIDGYFQNEQYIEHRKEEIKQWLKVKHEYECYDYSDDNICVINFRGGEWVGLKESFVSREYWRTAMSHMIGINKDFKFVVITDDVMTAKIFFPDLEVYHFDIAKDYVVIKNAKYLILSNLKFAWFPAWTNENLKFCIAPKYWGKHNVSDGAWNLGYALTKNWMYQTREGELHDYDKCFKEVSEYVENHPELYKK